MEETFEKVLLKKYLVERVKCDFVRNFSTLFQFS